MKISIKDTAEYLRRRDDFLLLMHASPDGDTVGSCFGLLHALRGMGKRARAHCFDEIPAKYAYITDVPQQEFAPQTVIAVDIADTKLLGKDVSLPYDIDLCVDHHPSNRLFAQKTLLDPIAAATAEIVYALILEMGCAVNARIAAALYTGIATDTGCFKFSNTTADSHRIAAQLIEAGIDYAEINRIMFDLKSKARIDLERRALESIFYGGQGKIALLAITREMRESTKAAEDELDGITSLPRQIEGVLIGLTLREQESGRFRISARTHAPVDASALCAHFGGGGHARAAGGELTGTLTQVIDTVMETAETCLRHSGKAAD